MLAELRRREILAALHTDGSVQTVQIADHLGVSQMTIRRDVDALMEERLLFRVRGGAIRFESDVSLPPDRTPDLGRSQALAEAASSLVSEGMVVGLAGGTATPELTRALCFRSDLTIVSNSLLAARVIDERSSKGLSCARLLLTGGTVSEPDTLSGPVALGSLRTLNTDIAFIDASGVDANAGFTCRTPEQSELLGMFARRASRTVIAAPDTILGVIGLCEIESLERVDVLVINDSADGRATDALRRRTNQLLLAPASPGR